MSSFNIHAIRLPKGLNFHLLKYPSPETTEHFEGITRELNHRTQSVGNNDRLKQRKQDILNNAEQTGDLIHEIHGGLDVRAVIALWQEIDSFIKAFPVSKPILARFRQVKNQLGLLPLIGLVRLFFKRFDQCGDIRELATFIRHEMLDRKLYSDELKRLKEHANLVLSEKGPQKIVTFTIKNDRELNNVIQIVGISEDQSGRYIDVCRQQYYIESLKRLEPGDDSKIFDELVRVNVSRQPYRNKCMGHEILSIMIQKGIDSGEELPENWRSIILQMAGDPRARGSSYHEWWSILSKRHIEAMQGWMAGLDLELFLKALENYAETSYDNSLKRMFPARARFLRGLYKNKLITLSKLFIGRAPGRYLETLYDRDKMPIFSRLRDHDLSVIYFKVGNVHLVEGSHSFSLRLYKDLPANHPFSFNVRPRGFGRRELGIGLAERCERQYGGNVFSVTHYPHLTWQHKVIQELHRQGVMVDPEWVLTEDDYREYRRRFPI